MLRKKRVATIAASPVLREYGTDRLIIFFIRILHILWKGNKIYEGLLFKFFSRFVVFSSERKRKRNAIIRRRKKSDCEKPRYLYLGDPEGEC